MVQPVNEFVPVKSVTDDDRLKGLLLREYIAPIVPEPVRQSSALRPFVPGVCANRSCGQNEGLLVDRLQFRCIEEQDEGFVRAELALDLLNR